MYLDNFVHFQLSMWFLREAWTDHEQSKVHIRSGRTLLKRARSFFANFPSFTGAVASFISGASFTNGTSHKAKFDALHSSQAERANCIQSIIEEFKFAKNSETDILCPLSKFGTDETKMFIAIIWQ